jgi:hypothetical protein
VFKDEWATQYFWAKPMVDLVGKIHMVNWCMYMNLLGDVLSHYWHQRFKKGHLDFFQISNKNKFCNSCPPICMGNFRHLDILASRRRWCGNGDIVCMAIFELQNLSLTLNLCECVTNVCNYKGAIFLNTKSRSSCFYIPI